MVNSINENDEAKSYNNRMSKILNRNSGIELLKVFGLFLIILNHVLISLDSENIYVNNSDYVLNLNMATTNMKYLLMSILQYSGSVGNTIFFICSAWFLIDSKKVNFKKWFLIWFETWIISIIILIIILMIRSGDVNDGLLLSSLLPVTFNANWYITCYLLFYPIHTILNSAIRKMNQKQLFRCSFALAALYLFFNWIKHGLFFSSGLLVWIAIYFCVSYVKLYLKDFTRNCRLNVILFFLSFLGNLCLIILTNLIGLKGGFFSAQLLHWGTNQNPFTVVMGITLVNLCQNINIKSKIINYISSLSLLIYVLHENILIRNYYRPLLFIYIWNNFGYNRIMLWVFIFTILILTISVIICAIYDLTIRQFVRKLCYWIYNIVVTIWMKFEKIFLKIT